MQPTPARALMRPIRVWSLLMAAALVPILAGCYAHRQGGDRGGPFRAFRRGLADPQAHAFRKGGAIQGPALSAAIKGFVASHRQSIDARLRASAERLERGAPPEPPAWTRRCAADKETLSGTAAVAMAELIRRPDVVALALRLFGASLPVCMNKSGMSVAKLGSWLTFFSLALPEVRRCGTGDDTWTLCFDYGGLDVIRVQIRRSDDAPTAIEWWQRRTRGAGPQPPDQRGRDTPHAAATSSR